MSKNIRRILAVFLFSVLIISSIPNGLVSVSAETKKAKGTITANELYVRNGPGTDFDNVMLDGEKVILKKDQEVVLYMLVDGWYMLDAVVNGVTVAGFSLGTYINTDAQFENQSYEELKKQAEGGGSDGKGQDQGTDPVAQNVGDDIPEDEDDIGPIVKPDNGKDKTGDGKKTTGTDKDKTEENDEGTSEYVEASMKFKSKFNLTGTVTAQKLNIRKTAGLDGKVAGVLTNEQQVWLVGSVLKSQTTNGVKKTVRWYRVIAIVDDEPVRGYVVSDYIKLRYGKKFKATAKYDNQVLYTNRSTKSAKLKNSKGKVISFAKDKEFTVVSEKQGKLNKWLKVKVKYGKKTLTGYIPAKRVTFVPNAEEITVEYLILQEPDAGVVENPSEVHLIDVPDGDGTENSDAGSETGKNKDDNAIDNWNAVISGAAALSVKLEPKYSAATMFTSDNIPVFLYTGQYVRVIEAVSDDDGNGWYKIQFKFDGTEYSGYVNKDYVVTDSSLTFAGNVTPSVLSQLTFEEKLLYQGFPESYRNALLVLHEKYPKWEFRLYNTGLSWNEVIAAESEVGVNLIPNTKGVEWKSLAAGAYSWKNDTFTVFDGSTWVTASKEAIEYYMDPRNFLDEASIFQFEVLTYNPSYQTKTGIETILKNTAMNEASYSYTDELGATREISYADTFVMAAEYSGVSPLHLASRVKQEVTIGKSAMSNSVTGTVAGLEGLYNFYNIGASHSTEAGGAIANGLRFAKTGPSSYSLKINCLIPWNNRLRSILGGAYYIGNNYINRGQNTIYLQKFNVTPSGNFWHQYMANVEAPYSEGKRVFSAYEDPAELAIVFSIPYFYDMPENACPLPQKALNPNNWLKKLELYDINGNELQLTPTFSYTKDQEYNLIVGSDVDYIKLNTKTVSTKASVLSEGAFHPECGENRCVISVAAENGDIREYVINIVREMPEDDISDDETASEEAGSTAEGSTDVSGTSDKTAAADGEGTSDSAD